MKTHIICELCLFCIVCAGQLMAASDRMDLPGDLFEYCTLDAAVKEGDCLVVGRWLEVKSSPVFGPSGMSSYIGKIEVLQRLYGGQKGNLSCTLLVLNRGLLDRLDPTNPPNLTPPPEPGELSLMIGVYRPGGVKVYGKPDPSKKPKSTVVSSQGEMTLVLEEYESESYDFQVRRFIEPDAANLRLIADLVRRYKAKELATGAEARKTLDSGLSDALREAEKREKNENLTRLVKSNASTGSRYWFVLLIISILASALGFCVFFRRSSNRA